MNLPPSDSICSLELGPRRWLDHGAQALGGGDGLPPGHADARITTRAALTVPARVISIGKKRCTCRPAIITAL